MQFQTNRNPERELTAPTERLVRSIIGLLINVCGLLPAGHRPPCGSYTTRKQRTAWICIQCMTKVKRRHISTPITLRTSPAAAPTQRASTTWKSSLSTALTQSFTHITALQEGC